MPGRYEWDWEGSPEHLNYRLLITTTVAMVLTHEPGSIERESMLRDLEALLSPYADKAFREEREKASNGGNLVARHDQWLRALVALMERKGFAGEREIRG